ncbi:Hypothetical predicted protein [Olea europaea subsp. europaea]|uniref:Uncharacterized protein n=1 Tax=Olea europaea subsp. europaea TaxID=158383 RepID=A0A8S0UI12_OLEEU|nr:Hypothetical predicted protein [Olea europaea subsp. europaea]
MRDWGENLEVMRKYVYEPFSLVAVAAVEAVRWEKLTLGGDTNVRCREEMLRAIRVVSIGNGGVEIGMWEVRAEFLLEESALDPMMEL